MVTNKTPAFSIAFVVILRGNYVCRVQNIATTITSSLLHFEQVVYSVKKLEMPKNKSTYQKTNTLLCTMCEL